MNNMKAIYVRTSSEDQDGASQRFMLANAAKARGWIDYGIYEDIGESGINTSRPAFDRLKTDVLAGRVREVLVVALDRIGRSAIDVMTLMNDWTRAGVVLVSLRENLDLSTPSGRFLVTVLAAFTELEREMIRDRQRAGIAAARAKGKHLGRPRKVVSPEALEEITLRRAGGESIRGIARALNLPVRTLRRILGRQLRVAA